MILKNSETYQVLYASQRSLLVGLWAQAHGCDAGQISQLLVVAPLFT